MELRSMELTGRSRSAHRRSGTRHRFEMKLVNPANKRKFTVIVVGSGLAGGAAAATLSELGYNVKCFCFQDSPRRAHSIAAQGGINAAKNYRNDGDSIYRLFYDTVKGGDFRAREANVYRLAQISVDIIDQCVAQGVPVRAGVRRAPGQPVVRRRAGLAHLLRARADRPAAAARRLPGAGEGGGARRGDDVPAHRDARPRRGRRPGPRHRGARHGDREDREPRRRRGRARHRRVRQRVLPLDQRQGLQRHRHLAGPQARGRVRQPVLHPDPPDLHSGERRLPVEAHADERVAPERRARLGAQAGRRRPRRPARSPRASATTISSASTRASATSRRATSPRGPPRRCATRAAASGRAASASTSTSPTPSSGSAPRPSGSGTATCSRCTSGSPTRIRTSCRCGSSRRCTTRWAGSGSTTT